MAVSKKTTDSKTQRKFAPATDPEARENQLIRLAMDRIEERILNGTATAAELLEMAKRGSIRNQLEKEKLRKENLLLDAKTDAIKSGARTEELYAQAIEAMRIYSGSINRGDD